MSDILKLPGLDPRTAEISPCGRYRYRLTRCWDVGLPALGWVMLNPSTADAAVDDPTIRRVTSFSQRAGYGSATVTNLFAWRATQPADLLTADDPFGQPRNVEVLEALFTEHDVVVAAWGAKFAEIARTRNRWQVVTGVPDHPKMIRAMANRHGTDLVCLGTTKDGSPRHPLYVSGSAPFIPWRLP
jgi:hypothetical protein